MILFHGTNVANLHDGVLAAGRWLTADIYTAADFSESRGGDNYIYVLWVEEQDVVYHVFPGDVIPAWQLKISIRPIGNLIFHHQKITVS